MNFLNLMLCGKKIACVTNNKNNGSQIFYKDLKNSLHGQIWSDFKKISLLMSRKA
jgi:hypothetical protein